MTKKQAVQGHKLIGFFLSFICHLSISFTIPFLNTGVVGQWSPQAGIKSFLHAILEVCPWIESNIRVTIPQAEQHIVHHLHVLTNGKLVILSIPRQGPSPNIFLSSGLSHLTRSKLVCGFCYLSDAHLGNQSVCPKKLDWGKCINVKRDPK